jgi:FkbM family methyltransferase
MTGGRTAAAAATDAVCRTVGRGRVVRAARFIQRRACLDGPNDMDVNGEIWLQHQVVGMSPPAGRILVLDVGANVGRWSSAMLSAASQAGRLDDLELHAFEPSAYTFARLSEALGSPRVTLGRMALGDRTGLATLHVIAPGAGTNSLYESSLAGAAISTEEVRTATLDDYAERTGLDGEIALVKIDTEGHDLAVLRGARGLLAGQRITVLQFEYNQRWIYSRTFLRDAFELLVPFGYSIGKLTWRGVEFYPGWDVDLESFVQANYVACAPRAATRIPSIRWWKTDQRGEMH